MVPFSFNWSDVGSWDSIWKIKKKGDQNVIDGNIVTENVTKSFIKTHDKSIAVIIGVKRFNNYKREGCSFSYKKKFSYKHKRCT